ncbi:MAG TPA: type II toxin-antitoxin system VapC family toxin [Gemmatimonadaceae bacterium]|nr:type II toxin-antitoxin system VapC family toxin [Gemmatimonadaceae bacterium]
MARVADASTALDTNVLVRFLVEDDAAQSAAAAAVVERAVAADEPLFVSDVVLCETVWVLAGSYRVPRADILAVLRDLLRARHLAFASPDQLTRALDAFSKGRGDFADYLIREHARTAGCDTVVTFEQALLHERGFVRP